MAGSLMGQRKFLRNFGSGAALRIGSAILGFALLSLMARMWPASEFGAYLVAFNLFQLLQQTPLLGLHFIIARDAAHPDGGNELQADSKAAKLPTAAALSVAVALVIAAALAFGVSRAYPADLRPVTQLVGLSLLPTAAILVVEMALMGSERLHLVAIVNIAEISARFVTFGTMIMLRFDVTAVLVAFVLLRFGALFLYLLDAPSRKIWTLSLVKLHVLRVYFRQIPVLFPVMIFAALFSRLDVAVLSWSVPPEKLAPYAVAARCYDLVLMVPSILVTVLLPVVTRVNRSDAGRPDGELDALVGLLLRYGLLIGLLCASAGATLAPVLLSSVFGSRYDDAILSLQLLLFAAVGTAVNQLAGSILLVRDRNRYDLLCLSVGLALLVPGLFIGIRIWGPVGAAVAVLVATLAQCAIRVPVLHYAAGVRISAGDLVPPLLATAAMVAVGWAGRSTLLELPAAILAFALVIWLAGFIRPRDFSVGRTLMTER